MRIHRTETSIREVNSLLMYEPSMFFVWLFSIFAYRRYLPNHKVPYTYKVYRFHYNLIRLHEII